LNSPAVNHGWLRRRREPSIRPLNRWLGGFLALTALTGFAFVAAPQGPASAVPGSVLNIVAHEDDDLLFLSPDLLHSVQGGGKVRTIFTTASDDGMSSTYWQSLEKGSQAAYAQMAGVPNTWTKTDAGIAGHPMPLYTLNGNTNISLIFMRLPDGNLDGSGFPSTGNQSLQKLWTGSISTIKAVDGSSSYTKASLISTLTSLMTAFQPSQIRTQDYAGSYGDGDHSDHHTTAYLTQAAQQNYTTAHTLTGYYEYNDSQLPANVSGSDLTAKQKAFYTYGPFDSTTCSSASTCAGTPYAAWLPRQYTTAQEYDPIADAGPAQTVQVNSAAQLNGAASYDPSGNVLTYQWAQTAGTPVTLSSTTAAKPTFTAPAGAGTLTFRLIVSNGQSTSSASTVTVTVTTGTGGTAATVLVGDTNVESVTDEDPAGTAEAFQYIAGASGTANSVSFYLDSSNSATSAQIGVYSDNGAPATLLASATDSSLTAGAWNTVTLPSFAVTSGSKYWIALLGSGGTISWRDSQSGLAADVSSSTVLSALPTSWSNGQAITSGGVSPASFYISNGTSTGGGGGGGGGGGTGHCTISEDASTPAVATSQGNTTGAITTGSFSPPAGSLLVATVNVGMGSVPPGTLSVTDSAGGTWTAGPSQKIGTTNQYGLGTQVFYRYLSSAPGAITVTGNDSVFGTDPDHEQSMQLAVRVVDGAAASQVGAATATASSTTSSTSATKSITTTAAGSWVYIGSALTPDGNVTANAKTTTINQFDDTTNVNQLVSGRQSAATATPGATTLGWTTGTGRFWTLAEQEILPATTC
jgi:LmbE family N-acetylglucosaminyl deacetylase